MAGQLYHRRRPTEQHQHIVCWGGQVLLDHVSSHEAPAVGPTCKIGRGGHMLQSHISNKMHIIGKTLKES